MYIFHYNMKCENQQRSYGCNTEEMISAQTWSTQLNTPGPVMWLTVNNSPNTTQLQLIL